MVIFISHGISGAEAINPVYNLMSHSGIPSLNISISEYTKNKLNNPIYILEEDIFNFIERTKPSVIINERSSGIDIQNKITKFCKEKNIFNCSILDFPGNYLEMFAEKPNLIFVPSDEIKKEMQSLGFKKDTIYVSGNPSFENLPKINIETKTDNIEILFVSQPLLKYNIHDEFKNFNEVYCLLKDNFKCFKLDIKLHHQSRLISWEKFIDKSYNVSFIEDIDYHKYDLIIGYSSTVIYKSSYMGIPTIFYNDISKQLESYKKGLPLENPSLQFRQNPTENIFNYLLNFV